MLSLVIATLEDEGSLRLCLESLLRQENAPPFEVVIVDQNDDDQVGVVVAEFADQLEIRHERVDFRAASRARNYGARLAKGDWVGFPDDDCVLLPDTLAQFLRVKIEFVGLKAITGRTVDENGVSNILGWGRAAGHFTPFSMFSSVTEATLFIESRAYAELGGFDERFGPGARYPAAEGVELVNRAFAAFSDRCAYYSPAIRMQHPTKVPPYTRQAAKRFHSYAIGDGALIAKSPQLHVLRWGLRTCVSAVVQIFSLSPWRSATFAARLVGVFRGFVRFHLDALRGQ